MQATHCLFEVKKGAVVGQTHLLLFVSMVNPGGQVMQD
jgi:hypothetical protein